MGAAGAGASLGTGLAACKSTSSFSATTDWTDRAGIQLYTFDKKMKSDMSGVFKTVAGLGFKEVEFVGAYIDRPATEIRAMLDDAGLKTPSGHIGYDEFKDETRLSKAIENANILGYETLLLPWIGESERASLDSYRRVADELTSWGQTCHDSGLRIAYHNHAFEFEAIDGEIPYDILLKHTDPALVDMELDLGWIEFAGQSAVDYISRFPGRFKLFHVKDFTTDKKLCPVGQGVVNFSEIFKYAKLAGLRHAYFEQDNPEDPVVSAQESFAYLKNNQIQMPTLHVNGVSR